MPPPAPARFSTTTGCLRVSSIRLARMRGITSRAPAGAANDSLAWNAAHRCRPTAPWLHGTRSKLELVAHRFDAGLGTSVVGVATRPTRHADRAEDRAARLDHEAATEDHHTKQISHAGLRHAGLGHGNEVGGVGAKAHRGPGLAGRSRRRMRTGKAIAQHHLRDAEAVHDGHRRLIAALAAFGEGRARGA